ncbi:curli-like amyloid fiber formation chaperone CsgH [Nioella nitratireducens]|uniref:curli-like amyloid fiber formation chaperone CsgH n=1 Tax=Nioella nitratireducens TaxID=1287720 RepID=UPI0008FD5908|nr:curli-like amyloid fiber formation chaperone CsgH [Nioella nitratireducens]
MTLPLKTRRFLPAALILAGAGIAAACTSSIAEETASTAPFACEIAVDESGASTQFQGRLQANSAVTGRYDLSLAGRGTNIRQAGAFTARADETVTLGQAMLSGPASRYDADLSITVNGVTYRCQTMATDL